MFDLGWTELLLIGIVALVVVGPKDLPHMFATLGRFTGKARSMAREFQRAMDDAARESGIKEASSDMKSLVSKKNLGLDKIEAAAKKFESWDPVKSARSKPAAPAPGSETAKLAEKRAAEAEARRAAAAAPAAKPAAKPAPKKPAAKAKAKPAAKPAAKAPAKSAAKPKSAARAKPATKAKSASKSGDA